MFRMSKQVIYSRLVCTPTVCNYKDLTAAAAGAAAIGAWARLFGDLAVGSCAIVG